MAKIVTTEEEAKAFTKDETKRLIAWMQESPSHKVQFMYGHMLLTVSEAEQVPEVLGKLISPYYIDKVDYQSDTAHVHLNKEWDSCSVRRDNG